MPSYRTVAEALRGSSETYPNNWFVFQDMAGNERKYRFPEIEQATRRRAGALQALGLRKGDRLGLIVIEPEDFILSFLAAIRIGVIPVPLYPPLSLGSLDAYTERTSRVLTSAGAKALIATTKLQNVLWQQVDKVPSLERFITTDEIIKAEAGAEPEFPEIHPEDICFLQYTSGSTSDPKGVVVSHESLIANLEGFMGPGLEVDSEKDVGVCWLPLYHDMGLIGFVIGPLGWGTNVCFIPPVRFIKKPSVWLDTIHRHRGTITFAPNFAFALTAKKAKPEEMARWDLSSLRIMGIAAEPIHPDTMREFVEKFHEPCGLPKNTILPAYGMAEATLAITMKPVSEEPRTRFVDATRFSEDGEVADPVFDDDEALVLEHVSCGIPFPKHELSIRDEEGNALPDGREGHIWLRGPSVTPGYFDNDDATAATFGGGWLRTGDLGYLLDGELYVTGRIKDLIILNGRNMHPQSIEWSVGTVDGVRKGNVVAFSRPGASTEELVVVLETRLGESEHEALRKAVVHAVRHDHQSAPADIICLPPGSLPKTSSGKLQRRKTRDHYLMGKLGTEGSRSVGATDHVKVAKHVARSLWTRARRGRGSLTS